MLRLNFPALFLIALMTVAHLVARPFDELTKAHRMLQWLELHIFNYAYAQARKTRIQV